MTYPDWAPPDIAKTIVQLQEQANNLTYAADHRAIAGHMAEMWERLATRPEMETVWKWYFAPDSPASSLASLSSIYNFYEHQGLFYRVSVIAEDFAAAPKLSPKAYQAEMDEIATLAIELAEKLRKFPRVPPLNSMGEVLSPEQLEDAAQQIADAAQDAGLVVETKGVSMERMRAPLMGFARYRIAHWLPDLPTLLDNLHANAVLEGEERIYHMYMPTKANAASAFRSFFVRSVAWHLDFSPARIAIFCSVALDDPDITADLVRSLIKEDKSWTPQSAPTARGK